jgi:hypothetical protein
VPTVSSPNEMKYEANAIITPLPFPIKREYKTSFVLHYLILI